MSVTVLRGRVADANDFRRTAPELMDASGAAQYLGCLKDIFKRTRQGWRFRLERLGGPVCFPVSALSNGLRESAPYLLWGALRLILNRLLIFVRMAAVERRSPFFIVKGW